MRSFILLSVLLGLYLVQAINNGPTFQLTLNDNSNGNFSGFKEDFNDEDFNDVLDSDFSSLETDAYNFNDWSYDYNNSDFSSDDSLNYN